MREIRKILLVRLSALGDIVHALPAQQRLHQRFPGTEIHWLADSSYRSLLECVPGVTRIWTTDLRSVGAGLRQMPGLTGLVRKLRNQKFDLVFDFQGLLKSAALARMAGSGRVYGFAAERFKEPGTGLFYHERLEGEADLTRHVIDSNLELVAGLTGPGETSAAVPLRIPEQDNRYVLERLGEDRIRKPILINPGAGWVTKRWPASQYGRLADRIQQRLRLPVVVTYGPGEEPLVDAMRASCGKGRLTAFPTTIVQLAALCRRSLLMVAGDCGPLHLAVANGTPTVAILGPTSARRNGPYAPQDLVVKRDLPCSNSYRRRCDEFICMDIDAEDVFQAVDARLKALSTAAVGGMS